MKFLPAQLAVRTQDHRARQNVRALRRLVAIPGGMIVVYNLTGHLLVAAAEQPDSWLAERVGQLRQRRGDRAIEDVVGDRMAADRPRRTARPSSHAEHDRHV